MPRKHVRVLGVRNYKNYTENDVRKAIEDIKGGMSQALASRKWKIPRGTLQNRLLARHNKQVGRQTLLSPSEEKLIADTLRQVADWGFPLGPIDLRIVVQKYLNKQGRNISVLKGNMPGKDFVGGFMRRNKLSMRTAASIKRARSSVGRAEINEFFSNIKTILNGADSACVYNYDETNITDDPGSKKVLVPRGMKRVERVQEHSRTSVSIMICGNANGDLLPPMVVYKASNLYQNWTTGGPPGTIYGNSSTGWFDMNLFEKWFFEILLPHTRKQSSSNTKIVIGDNLASHFSPAVIKAALDNNIYMTPLPPNSTHLMQPLDVSCFAPLKKKWRGILEQWRKESRQKGTIPKELFPSLLKRLWDIIDDSISTNLKSGFRATGLHPFSPDNVLSKLPGEPINLSNEVSIQRSLDSSLIELLQENRGTSKVGSRKRGSKIRPGQQMVIDQQEEQPGEPQAGPSGIQVGNRNSSHRERIEEETNNDLCSICETKWSSYKGCDWLKCITCHKWVCGYCHENSKNPYFECARCEDDD